MKFLLYLWFTKLLIQNAHFYKIEVEKCPYIAKDFVNTLA
jgi:hypothetical protein